jgi:hypothetical protein
MTNYSLILSKIHRFTQKFYLNELLKGAILFTTIGLLYFFLTLFIEYFLWLKPIYRTFLFWIFIFVEIALIYKFILIPILRLFGLKNGINAHQASKLIGKHFPEIDDKLLNMLQLYDSFPNSELVIASIDQKAENLKPFSFQSAINLKSNKKYIKFLLIPLSIWFLLFLSGYNFIFSKSYNRLVHHQTEFVKPAPFKFIILNKSLNVIEGGSIKLQVQTSGTSIPEEVYIILEGNSYFLQRIDAQNFIYQFNDIRELTTFHLEANNIVSPDYKINIINIPQIQSINLKLHYPAHLNLTDQVISNTGNAQVPEGTIVTWHIQTNNTASLQMKDSLNEHAFKFDSKNNLFYLSKDVRNPFEYTISSSNANLKNYENLSFAISVVKDAFPEIKIESDIDSLQFGEAHFVGRITDDYGISKLNLVYYPTQQPNQKITYLFPIKKTTLEDFYYVFPHHLNLTQGVDYSFYFEVFDNDKVNGFKSTKSQIYSYHKDTEVEYNERLLENQEENLKDINQLLNKQEKNQKELEMIEKQLQNKSEVKFNETQQIQQLLKRQQQYDEMMQRQSEELKKNLQNQKDTENKDLNEKKEDIQKRLDEIKQSEEQKKLLDELEKLVDKLSKEDLLDRIQKLNANNKQKEKSLEQLLELTKRFYVEQLLQQVSEKLSDLAEKQEKLKDDSDNSKSKQDELKDEFNKISEQIKELMKQNSELKDPIKMDDQKLEQESVKQDMQQASDQLEQKNQNKAKPKQQSAANKMKQMSQSFQMQMQAMQGDMIEEDIASLRRIIENLITFSFKQEDLMNSLDQSQQSVSNLSVNLKNQNQLKTYFEHIDDSLYTLAMRQAKLSPKINEYVANANFYLRESNESLSENQIAKTKSNQQFVMTAANDLASLLSSLLDNLQNPPPAFGQGKGKGEGQSFSLPDIIQKQGDLKKDMQSQMQKEGDKSGDKEGEKEGEKGKNEGEGNSSNGKQNNGENQSKELYEIYKQQEQLRQALEDQLPDLKGVGLENQANSALKQMEQLEKLLLEKGITNEVLQKMMRLEQELLKLKNAAYEQGIEEKRISQTNYKEQDSTIPKQVEEFFKRLNQQELLNRDPIPFLPSYNQKVIEYFKN